MLVQVGNRFISEQSSHESSALYSQNLKDVLLQNKFFQDCHEEFIRDLIVNISRKRYVGNRYLIEESTRGDSMFVLYKGLVEVSANGRVICRLKDGSVFGEMALLDVANRRTATVKTLEKCDCAVIFRNMFFHLLEKYPWERRKFQREAKRKLLQLGKLISVKGEDINLAQQASDLDALRQIPFFQQEEFSDDFVSEIALNVTSVFLKPGTLIMQEGDPPASKLYIMLRGVAEVSKDGQFLQRLEYAMLGDISAVGPGVRAPATIRTVTACHLHTLERNAAQAILAKFPQERQRLVPHTSAAFIGGALEDERGREGAGQELVSATVPTNYRASGNCIGNPAADEAMFASNADLVENVEKEFLSSLTPYLATVGISGGQEVISEGDDNADSVYFVQRGKLTVWRRGVQVNALGPGSFVGEAAVLERGRRRESVRVDVISDLRVMNAEAFLLQLRKYTRASMYFRRIAKERDAAAEATVAARRSAESPHYDFLFLKCANPIVKRGKKPGSEQTREDLQLGLVLDFAGPGCAAAAQTLPDKLFDPIRQDTRAPALSDRPNYIHAALKDYSSAPRPEPETWA
jgi:CRP-like cAMP-binding protein